MANIINNLLNVLRRNTFFVVSMGLFLTLPNLLLSSLTKRYIMFNFGFAFSWVILELFIIWVARSKKWERNSGRVMLIVKGIIWGIVLLFCVVNYFLILNFNSVLNAYYLQLLSETNGNETWEFVSTYILQTKSIHILALVSIVILISLFFQKISNTLYSKNTRFLGRLGVCVFVILFVFWGKFITLSKYFGPNYVECYRNSYLTHNPLFVSINSSWQYFDIKESFAIASRTHMAYSEDKLRNRMDNDERIVLIIGESFNKHHSSVYGYDLQTSPHMENRDILVFNNVIACSNSTSIVMNYLFSTASVNDMYMWNETPLFPAVFLGSDCPVYFWSNQFGAAETSLNVWGVNASFLNLTEISNKCFTKRNKHNYQFDGDLVSDFFEKRSQEPQTRSLDIIHLMGSHVNPKDRYPQNFDVFTDESYSNRTDLNKEQRLQIAYYDNSILYNDMVLDQIIDYYKDKNSIVIAVADHGDEANDFRPHIGRSFDFKETGEKVFHCQLDVPFVIYMSPLWREKNQEMEAIIESKVNTPFMTDDVCHILFDIAGINSKWFRPEKSLFNDDYIVKDRYFIIQQQTSTLTTIFFANNSIHNDSLKF